MSLSDVIMLNIKDYFDTVLDFYINLLLFAIAIALCVAAFIINHHKSYTIALIRQLLRHGATSEEKAKSLSQLRLDHTFSIKRALSRRGQLTDVIKRAGEVALSYEEYTALMKEKAVPDEKIDFDTAKFYIPESKLAKAREIEQCQAPSVIKTLLFCVLILAIFICIALLMPEILTYLAGSVQ